jgi:aldehyde:ferredoxin oxidoreductase
MEDRAVSATNSVIRKKVLVVDLNTGKIDTEVPDDDVYRRNLGGRALGQHFFLREIPAKADPLGPDNVLVFASGLLNGTPGPGTPKYSVITKSPLTGGIGESEAGGFWGSDLRYCGYDAIVVKGSSPKPVYLAIENGEPSLRDATELWQSTTKEFQDAVRESIPKARVLQIGPAGANGSLIAAICNDLSFFNGRNGLGAVMGSKNLRAIVLAPESKKLDYEGLARIREVAKAVGKRVKENPLSAGLNNLGTSGGVKGANAGGVLPTRNWTKSTFDGAEAISGDQLIERGFLTKRHGCFACPVQCKRVVEIHEGGIDVDPDYGGPEYENLGSLGSMCEVGDLPTVCKANELCNAYAIDAISAGNTIAFAMDLFEKGIITEEQVGYDLSFGNGKALLRMLEDMAFGRGFGKTLAKGSYRAAEEIGGRAMDSVVVVKKQEPPMHDPRFKSGISLQYAVSPRGADHWTAQHDPFFVNPDSPGVVELAQIGMGTPVGATDYTPEKVRWFYYGHSLCSAYDTLGVCTLAAVARSVVKLDEILEMAKAATGWELSWFEILKNGERANNQARLFNLREGLTAEDDKLPGVFFQAIGSGPHEGSKAIDESELSRAVSLYYEMAGWDENGVPRPGKLVELGIAAL